MGGGGGGWVRGAGGGWWVLECREMDPLNKALVAKQFWGVISILNCLLSKVLSRLSLLTLRVGKVYFLVG